MKKIMGLIKKTLWGIYISFMIIIVASFIFDFPLLPRLDRDLPHQYLKVELKSSDGSKISIEDVSDWYDEIGRHNVYFKEDSDNCSNLIKDDSDEIWKDIKLFAQSFSMLRKINPIEITAQCFSVSKVDKDCQAQHTEAQNHLLAIIVITDIENDKKKEIIHKILNKPSNCRNPIATSGLKKNKNLILLHFKYYALKDIKGYF